MLLIFMALEAARRLRQALGYTILRDVGPSARVLPSEYTAISLTISACSSDTVKDLG